MTKKAYKSNSFYLVKLSLSLNVRDSSLFSATSVLSPSPMAYNTTASLDKLTCTKYVDFKNCQNRFGRFAWSKKFNYLEIKLKVFKRDENRDFWLVQNLTTGEAVFDRFIRLRNQLAIAAEDFGREDNLSSVLIPTMSKDKDEQLKLAHKKTA